MPGYMIAYHCSCGFEGHVSPGAPNIMGELRVAAFDPEINEITTIDEKKATARELYIYIAPFATTFTRHHPVARYIKRTRRRD